MPQYITLPLIGFLVGILVISLGGGGGAIYVGLLTTFFNVPPAIAAATSLATIIPTTAIGTFSHWRNGNINLRMGLTMLAGGVVGSVIGSLCSSLLPQSLYNKLTGAILLLLSIQMFITYLQKKRKIDEDSQPASESLDKRNNIKAIIFGLLGGGMSGLVGLSGSPPIVAGLAILGCSALETVGTSVLVVLGISITGFTTHLGLGSVDWKLVGLLIIGTISGAFVGPFLLKRIKKGSMEKVLQPLLIVMIIVMGVMLFIKK